MAGWGSPSGFWLEAISALSHPNRKPSYEYFFGAVIEEIFEGIQRKSCDKYVAHILQQTHLLAVAQFLTHINVCTLKTEVYECVS